MTLGGVLFVYNAWKHDYNILESIACLKELCDEVVVLDAGSDDGTAEIVRACEDDKTLCVCLEPEAWLSQTGRDKLSFFQNIAKSFLGTDYYFLLQADEIIHEDCFPAIREAIKSGSPAFYCSRINLWGSAGTYINVPHDRQPCGTKIIRLAKLKYKSVDDGEGIDAPASQEFIDKIRIYHYGFVRKKEVMKSKIIHMQEDVFNLGHHDPKLDGGEVFDSTLWFSGDDLSPITEPHSKFIKHWIKNRP